MATAARELDMMRQVGTRLARTREALGLTQEQLAEAIGVSRSTYGNWEAGHRLPDTVAMVRMCGRYRVTLDWVYAGDPRGLPREEWADALVGWAKGNPANPRQARQRA